MEGGSACAQWVLRKDVLKRCPGLGVLRALKEAVPLLWAMGVGKPNVSASTIIFMLPCPLGIPYPLVS